MLATIVIIYLFALLMVSLYARQRIQSEEDYLVAGRRLPLFLAWGTLLATWFGAATMIGAAQAARDEGVRGTVLDPFASGTALIVAGLFFAKPLWEMRLLTLADFYAQRFGRRAELVASVIMVPGYFGWIAAQFLALATLQSSFFGIPHVPAMLIAFTIILAYTMIGGMWSVTLTDTIQIAVVLVTLVILAVATLQALGNGQQSGWQRLIEATPHDRRTLLPELSLGASIGWLATWATGIFGNLPGQDLFQRVFAARSARTAQHACWIAGVCYVGFGMIPVGLGLASSILLPDELAGGTLMALAQNFLASPLIVVFVVSLLSIIISTCTSAVLSPASIVGHNLLGRIPWFRARGLLTDRLAVAVVATAGLLTAFSGHTILELLELSLSIAMVSLFVPLVFGIYGPRRGETAALSAMIAGILVWVPRELTEWLLLPMSAEETGDYATFIAEQATQTGWPNWVCQSCYGFFLLPSAISGTLLSLLAYFIAPNSNTSKGAGTR